MRQLNFELGKTMMAYNYKSRRPWVASAMQPEAGPETSTQSFGMVQPEFDDSERWVEHVVETIRTHGSY